MNKATLRQYQALIREIGHLEQEKQRVLDSLLAPPAADGMPHCSGVHDPVGSAAAYRDKYQRMIDTKLNKLIGLRCEIEAAIAGLTAANRDLMRLRYIDGRKWEDIAAELNYDIRWVHRLHGRILVELNKKP